MTRTPRGDLARIVAVGLDVDGVLTDDGFLWGPDGQEWKRFAFLDVMGVSRATRAGVTFALISGEASPLVDRYAAKMGIAHVWKGAKDKAAALENFAAALGVGLEQVAFVGNDVNDLGAMRLAGYSSAPADAHPEVLAAASFVSSRRAGDGAVREFLDRLLAARATSDAPATSDAVSRPSLRERIAREVHEHQRAVAETFERETEALSAIVEATVEGLRAGGKLMFCGNGGSAADAQHIAAEFVNRLRFDRPALAALALTVDSSVLTCIGNDASFEQVFARQIEALARPGDLLFGISTSGRSPNVLAALRAARRCGVVTVGFTGGRGRELMSPLCDHLFVAASSDTARIQEAHELSFHTLAALVESSMFAAPDATTQLPTGGKEASDEAETR